EPMVKEGSDLPHLPASWPQAVAAATEGLRKFAGEEIAVIASGRMTNEELFLTRMLAEELGTTSLAIVPRTGEGDGMLISPDRNPNTTGAKLVWKTNDPAAEIFA